MAPAARLRGDSLPVLTGAPHVVLTLFTDDVALAAEADTAGVDRIGPDLEVLEKAARQRGLGYRLSGHRAEQLPALRNAVEPGRLFARTDPVNAASAIEVERLVDAGVDVLMLPMFSTAEEVDRFCGMVGGRARVVLLLETASAIRELDEILPVSGVDEVHVGLNDLALSLGLSNRFGVLAEPWLDDLAVRVRAAGLPFAVGGIGRLDDRRLPVPPDLVYAALVRLGATGTLLARSFVDGRESLVADVARARGRLAQWWRATESDLTRARLQLARLTA